ncbi:MAG: acylneuraminate cytidylyltransferase family protein [Nitrosarchaeum sp.]|nr:acylneuraminate cytidylyltransferase family protein [Nitrosarchaeum sp.]
MKNIVIITARSGSKGVPNKNIRKLGKVPLLGWVTSAAGNAKSVDKIILSTDSEEYFKVAKKINKDVLWHKRSKELSEDVPSELVLLAVLEEFAHLFEQDSFLILIQPTTPFVSSTDIEKCISLLKDHPDINTCISVKQVSEQPEWMIARTIDNIGSCRDLAGDISVRQNLQQRWIANGGVYVIRRRFLEEKRKVIDESKTLIYEMPKIRSMDIDHEDDFIICESLVIVVRLFHHHDTEIL